MNTVKFAAVVTGGICFLGFLSMICFRLAFLVAEIFRFDHTIAASMVAIACSFLPVAYFLYLVETDKEI